MKKYIPLFLCAMLAACSTQNSSPPPSPPDVQQTSMIPTAKQNRYNCRNTNQNFSPNLSGCPKPALKYEDEYKVDGKSATQEEYYKIIDLADPNRSEEFGTPQEITHLDEHDRIISVSTTRHFRDSQGELYSAVEEEFPALPDKTGL